MSTVDVSPAALRDAGQALNRVREGLVEESNVHLLHGAGGDQSISTAGFRPGVLAQQLLTNQYQRAQEVFQYATQNLTALSSALHIVADVYESADHAAAFEFAFMNPDVDTLAGAPPWVDRANNSVAAREQAAAQGDGGLPDGWREEVTTINPGASGVPAYTIVKIYDAEGNLVGRQTTMEYSDGREIVEQFDAENNLLSRTDQTPTANGGYTAVTYNGSGQVVTRREHAVTPHGGSTTHTYTGNNPNPDRSEVYAVNGDGSSRYEVTEAGQEAPVVEFEVGAQPRVDGSDGLERTIEEGQELAPQGPAREEFQELQEAYEAGQRAVNGN